MIFINCKEKKIGRLSSTITKMIIYFIFIKKKFIFIFFNVNKIILKKNFFFKHSGYIGNLKKIKNNNIYCLKKSIFKMLPKNKSRNKIIKKIYFINNL